MSLPNLTWKTSVIVCGVAILLANLVYLDFMVIKLQTPTLSTKQEEVTKAPADICDAACVEAIYDRMATLSAVPASPTSVKTARVSPTSTVKEFYIPLGTGMTTNNQWEDVTGAEITLDPANYPNIMEVHFEAGLRIPVANGTVTARLYNVTDQHPVWFSDVSAGTSNSTFASSGKITLDKGAKLYRVQLMSSLQYPAFMDMARVKIVVK